MAESLGASPLPVLNNGVTCQFVGHSYIAPLETETDRQRFEAYLKGQLDKIKLPNKDEAFLRQKMLEMYANPLKNKLAAQ